MINTDLSVQKRWVARRSFNNSFTLTITSGGSAYNVSSYTFSANIRKIGASTNSLQLTEGSGITNGGATGIVTVQLSAANSETLTVGSYYYEINYTVSLLAYGLLHGTFDLLSEYNPESENNAVSISVNLAGTDVNMAITLGGTGISSFSSGNLSPLFTTSVATATTTPALSFTAVNQNANLVYAGPSTGSAAAPTFRALVSADLPFTGTPDGTKFLRDDLVWSVPAGGGTIGGSLADTQVAFGNGSNAVQGAADFTYVSATKTLTIGQMSIRTHGTGNIYMGIGAGNNSSTTAYNIAIGNNALAVATTVASGRNVAIGDGACANCDDQYNVGIGYQALTNAGAGENVGIGYRAIYNTQGEDNIGIGFGPGARLTGSGRNNTFIGYYAAAQAAAYGTNEYTNGNHSIFIGAYTYVPNATESSQINIGNVFFSRYNTNTNPVPDVQTGNVGLMVSDPTARLHLPANSATANKASFKMTLGGSLLATPESGAIEAIDTHIYWTSAAGTRYQLDQQTSSAAISGLTAASATNTINNADYAQEWQWNTLSSNTGLLLSSSSTAAASNTQTVFRVNQTGANGTASQTTYAGYFSNVKTGTTNTNVALYATATGASTINYAIQTLGGALFETSTGTSSTIRIKSSSGAEWWTFDNGRVIYLNSNGSSDRITPTLGTLAFLAANATAIDHYTFTGNSALTATSGTARMMVLSKGITVSSGTTVFTALDIVGTYNITGGTLTVNGIKYAPTLTSMTGATHYFINAASGRVLLGGLPTSAAGLATGELWNNAGVVNVA